MYALNTNSSAEQEHHSQNAQVDTQQLYDLICIGFGTAGLALAMALADRGINGSILFLESAGQFSESSELKQDSKSMRINFCQDLATARDPTSEFSFLNYLHESGRLEPFMDAAATNPCPSREDFNSYLEWAAERFAPVVAYGMHAVDVQAVKTGLPVGLWSITAQDGNSTKVLAAKNVVFAKGGEAKFAALGRTKMAGPQSEAMQMMKVTDMVQALCNSCNTAIEDEQISTLAISSGKLVSSLFDGKPLFMIHAML